jgi:hypothetical protein
MSDDTAELALRALFEQYVSDYLAGTLGASTPLANLPYPSPTDPVYQGAAAIQALATALDALVFPRDYRAINGTTSVSVSTGVWTKVGGWNTTAEAGSVGTGITSSANGLQLNQPGVYLLTAMVEWAGGSAGGRRILGFGPASGAAAGAYYRAGAITPDTSALDQTYAETLYVDAASVGLWQPWVNQNTAATLALANRRFTARRIA